MKKILCIGETLLRFTPQNKKLLKNAMGFDLNIGGSELNIALNMAKMKNDVALFTALPNNSEISENVLSYFGSYGLNQDYISFQEGRIGTYYFEPKLAMKTGTVIFDRVNTVFSNLEKKDFQFLVGDFDLVHTSGIMLGSSPRKFVDIISEKLQDKKETVFSLDCNFRAKQWTKEECFSDLKKLVSYCDILFANAWDILQLENESSEAKIDLTDTDFFIKQCQKLVKKNSNIKYVAFSTRFFHPDTTFDFQGFLYFGGHLYQSKKMYVNQVVDRIGCGDAFVAGILHGILHNFDPQLIIDYGTTSSWLKHSVLGDTNVFTEREIMNYLHYDPSNLVKR